MTLGARTTRTLGLFILALALLALYHPAGAHAARGADTAPATPATVYASVSNVGVFRDSGPTDSWAGLTALPPASSALAIATGDAAHWRDVVAGLDAGGGVYASHDNGSTWSAGLPGRTVRAVLLRAQSPNTIFAGTDRGLYRSDDGGKTWASTPITASVGALAQSAQGTIYAGGSDAGEVWVNRNANRRWSALRGSMPAGTAIDSLTAAGPSGATVYAATTTGVWRYGSGQWTQLHGGLPAREATDIAATTARILAVVVGDNLYVSNDGGTTWAPRTVRGLTSSPTVLAQDPQQPDTLVTGDKNGTVEWSVDGGQTWNPLGSSVAGNGGSPIRALAIVQRTQLPVDAVQDPHQAGEVYTNGHTVQSPFLSVWQANQDVLGAPETEAFSDAKHGGVLAQYFVNMELLVVDGKVVPAPLGADAYQTSSSSATPATGQSYAVDARFQSYWSAHQALLGAPISPLLKRPTGDGTGQSYPVQYFRNARLEYHPVVGVTLGKLGDQALQALGWL